MVEINLSVTIQGGEQGYYDAKEIASLATAWIEDALSDRDDISSCDVVVMPDSVQDAHERADEYYGHWQDQIHLNVELEDRLIKIMNKVDDLVAYFQDGGDDLSASLVAQLTERRK